MNRLLTAARQYTQAQFRPTPLQANGKNPILPRWQERDPLDDAEIERFWGNGDEHNLGLVCGLQPSGVNLLAIDVDPKNGGDEDIADLIDRLGPLPPSPRHDTPSGGYHLFFSMPSDYTLSNVKLAPGVDTRSTGGQVAAPPSTIDGKPYLATIQTSVLRCPIPPLPNAWVAELRGRGAPVAASIKRHPASQGLTLGEMAGGWRPFDYVNDHLVFTEALLRHGWTEMRGERWCRPGKNPRDGHSAELHDGRKLVIFTSDIPDVVRAIGLPTVGGFVSLTLSDFLIAYEHGGDVEAFKRWARERYGPAVAGSRRAGPGPDSPEEAGTPPAEDNGSSWRLPVVDAEYWRASKRNAHILAAARAEMVSPDALDLIVMAIESCLIPHGYRMPSGGHTPQPLNFLACLVGQTGLFKSTTVEAAWNLVGPLPPWALTVPIGSGEGMGASFLMDEMEEVQNKNGTTSKRKTGRLVRNPAIRAALFEADEGLSLAQQSKRLGATVIPAYCKGWSGSTLGEANADPSKRRIVQAGTYRMAGMANIQPALFRDLFSVTNTSTGLTGRFMFSGTTDADIPDEISPWPGEMEHPAFPEMPLTLEVDESILTAARSHIRHLHRTSTLTTTIDALTQNAAVIARMAAIHALVDDRRHVTTDDMDLAKMRATASAGCLAMLTALESKQDDETNQGRAMAQAHREIVVESVKERRAVASMAENIHRHVKRDGRHAIGQLRKKVSEGKTRYRFEAALELAVANGWVEIVDGGVEPA